MTEFESQMVETMRELAQTCKRLADVLEPLAENLPPIIELARTTVKRRQRDAAEHRQRYNLCRERETEERERNLPPKPPIRREGEGKEKISLSRARRDEEMDTWFNAFWKAYPKYRTRRADCLSAFRRILQKSGDPSKCFSAIMAGLSEWRNSARWVEDNGQFVIHPWRFLEERHWDVEPGSLPKAEQAEDEPRKIDFVPSEPPDLESMK